MPSRFSMKSLLLAFALLLATVAPATAEPITYQLAGTVTTVDAILPGWLPGIDVGDPLVLYVTWDEVPFPPPFFAFQLFVGDFRVSGTNDRPVRLDPLSWFASSLMIVEGPIARFVQPDFLGVFGDELLFAGLDLQLCPPSAPRPCDDTPGFVGSIDSVAQVPDAGSTLTLLTLGLGGALGLGRGLRRRPQPSRGN